MKVITIIHNAIVSSKLCSVTLILVVLMCSHMEGAIENEVEKTPKRDAQASGSKDPDVKKEDGWRAAGNKRVKGRARSGAKGPELRFKQIDRDHNGVLSFEEFSQSERLSRIDTKKRQALFDFLDGNKDGRLEGFELKPREPSRRLALRKNFLSLDSDGDGKLNEKEFSQLNLSDGAEREKLAVIFKHMDRNGDHYIDSEELHKKSQKRFKIDLDFEKYDINKSVGLDLEEYSQLPLVHRFSKERQKKHFERIDSNGDGELSPEEIQEARQGRPHPLRNEGKGRRREPDSHRDRKADEEKEP